MPVPAISLVACGMVTSVGLDAPASTAAMRCGVSNATQTPFIDWGGEPILAHQVPLEAASARQKLFTMAAMAIEECLARGGAGTQPAAAVLLGVAEPQRPGRCEGVDDGALEAIAKLLGRRFAPCSRVLAGGRVAGALALHHARELLARGEAQAVVVAGTDSLVNWSTLSGYEAQSRVLTSQQSNGFIPGEAAGAVLVTLARDAGGVQCLGLGAASEASTVSSGEPLRGQALAEALRRAAGEAGWAPEDVGLQVGDMSGEQYFFSEAALARARLARRASDDIDVWHPAEWVGEVGAAIGPIVFGAAMTALRKGYSGSARIACHFSGECGQRAAAMLGEPAP